MFGPAIGGCLYDLGGFSLPFFVTGIAMMLFSFMSLLFFTEELHDGIQNGSQNVSWMDIWKVAGVQIGIFAIFFAGMSKRWYTASLGPFLKYSYGLSSSQIGLVCMPFGLAYTLFAPFVGFITDKGLNSLITIIVGKLLILLSNLFLGPIPPISAIMWVTVAAITLQGIGSAFAYIGTLTFMTKRVLDSGLPKTEQASAMVSSLWLASECMGCFIGSTLGSVAFDTVGFQMGTLILACSMGGAVFIVVIQAWRTGGLVASRYGSLEHDEKTLLCSGDLK